MALPRWPVALPRQMMLEGQGEKLPDGLLRSDNDAGPAKVRRRSSATPWEMAGTFRMTHAQYDAFRAFVDQDIAGGALPFEFPHQRDCAAWLLVRVKPGDVTAVRVGPGWRVSMKLEVLP
jgi:hypothetical protein